MKPLITIILLMFGCSWNKMVPDTHDWIYKGWINEAVMVEENVAIVHFEDADGFEQLGGVFGLKLYNRYLYICNSCERSHWKVEYFQQ